MRKITIITFAIITVVVSAFFILRPQTYSLYDIDADNYEKKLSENEGAVYQSGIQDCIPDKFDIYNLNPTPTTLDSKPTKEVFSGGARTQTLSSKTGLLYTMNFNNKNETMFSILAGANDNHKSIREIADQLILKKGFLLKKSRYVSGNDILIKETDDSFLIVKLYSKYDGILVGLDIKSYSKKRFF